VPLGEEIPLERLHQKWYLPKIIISLLLARLTSTADDLSVGTNVDDLE